MHAIKRHLGAGAALALVFAAISGSAFAAKPSAPPGQEQTPPGQEQTPPGQENKAEENAAPAAPEAKATAPGQVKKATSTPKANASKSSGVNSTSSGVKPSNSTSTGTKCWTGGSASSPTCGPGAQADNSKRYGNGQTAAQVANSNGAPAGTEVRGPGNSQPHKVCKKVNQNGNEAWVDVHSMKAGSWTGCTTTTSTTSTTSSTASATTSSASSGSSSPAGAPGGVAGTSPVGGVAGVEATAAEPSGGAGGVAGAFGVLGQVAGGVLPFTGLSLWAIVLIALAAVAIGYALWRRSHAPTARDVV